jgi:hypothetical protein
LKGLKKKKNLLFSNNYRVTGSCKDNTEKYFVPFTQFPFDATLNMTYFMGSIPYPYSMRLATGSSSERNSTVPSVSLF